MATDKSRIGAQIKPLIGAIQAAELTRADVEKLKVSIAEGKATIFTSKEVGRRTGRSRRCGRRGQ